MQVFQNLLGTAAVAIEVIGTTCYVLLVEYLLLYIINYYPIV